MYLYGECTCSRKIKSIVSVSKGFIDVYHTFSLLSYGFNRDNNKFQINNFLITNEDQVLQIRLGIKFP